jgi:processive 1,2-diacylglycerol beta-glucosyltransferase
MVDLLVIHAPVGGGHRSAAEAVCEAARKQGYSSETLDAFAFAPGWYRDLYLSMHFTGQAAAPALYGAVYAAADRKAERFSAIRRNFEVATFARLRDRVRELSPRAVIATHHLPLVALGKDRHRGFLHALGAVVTDYTAHAFWAETEVDAFFVGSERVKRDLTQCGIASARVQVTGIPTQARFDAVPAYCAPEHGARARVLLTSGGFGIGPMERVLRSFKAQPDLYLRVICGRDAALRERTVQQMRAMGIAGDVLGFERDMAMHVEWAHVVVGKAGGLTVTETLVAGRPMVVTGAVPGNEKVNETLVVASGAGIAVRPDAVGATIARLRAGGLLGQYAVAARATLPRGAAATIVQSFMRTLRMPRARAA